MTERDRDTWDIRYDPTLYDDQADRADGENDAAAVDEYFEKVEKENVK